MLCEIIDGVEKHRLFFVLEAKTMVVRLRLTLEKAVCDALLKIAEKDLCNSSDQAHFLLREELAFRGLLICENISDEFWDNYRGGAVN
jgi:hypothetical protein